MRDRLSKLCPLPHTERIISHRPFHRVGQFDCLKRRFCFADRFGVAEPVKLNHIGYPLQSTDPWVSHLDRRAQSDPAQQSAFPPRIFTEQADGPNRRAKLTENQIDQRGFARPVGAEQAIRSRAQTQAQVVDADHGLIKFGCVDKFNH